PKQHLFDVKILAGTPGPAVTASPAPSAAGGDTASPTPSASDTGTNDAGTGTGDAATAAYDTRLRLAVLEEWDGVTWHTSADYRGAGRVLPPLDLPAAWSGHPDAPPLDIQEKITVDGLKGRLLPAVPTPSRVDGL